MRSQHYENRHPNPKSNPYYRHFTKSLITQIYCNIIQASAYIAMTCVIHSADKTTFKTPNQALVLILYCSPVCKRFLDIPKSNLMSFSVFFKLCVCSVHFFIQLFLVCHRFLLLLCCAPCKAICIFGVSLKANNNITILKPEFTCTQCSNGCQCVLCNFQ